MTIHIALPGATQYEVLGEEAEALVKAGVRIVAEGSNMGLRPKLLMFSRLLVKLVMEEYGMHLEVHSFQFFFPPSFRSFIYSLIRGIQLWWCTVSLFQV